MHTYTFSARWLRLGTVAALLLGLASALLGLPNRLPASAAAGDYSVSGNHVLDPNGNIFYIHGVARSGYEVASNGSDGHWTQTDFNNIAAWNANTVRIAFNESFMLSDSACYDANYLGRLDAAVTAANTAGMNVIFDLHWNTANTTGCATGQQNMADRRSLTAWNIMANRYKTNHKVFFELYNEPHDISWAVWKNGDGTWAGMQEMYNTVRNAGYTNIVLMGGLNWAYDLSGVPSNRPAGYGIVYVTHPYDFAGKQPADWPTGFGFLTSTDPVVATEFGDFNCTTGYVSSAISYFDAPAGDTNRRMGWTGWAWNSPGSCGFPSIINDWNGTPSTMGGPERTALLGYGAPPPTPTKTNTPTGPTSTPASGTIRVESGGTANFTDMAGHVWAADNGFSGGSTVDRGAIAIANTNDDRIYQTERYGAPFSYAFNVANGTYTVNLHFAETYFTSSGQRVFSVTAEGSTIVSNLDIFAAAGANTALIRTATVTVNDGQLNLTFTPSVNNALVNGIEIIPGSSPTATPTRTNTPVPPTPTRTNTPSASNLLTNGDMENGTTAWTCNGCTETSVTSQFHGGTHSLSITGRSAAWAGPNQDVTSKMTNGKSYTSQVWIKTATGTPSARITIKVVASTTTYIALTPNVAVNSSGWTLVSGTATVSWSGTLTQAVWYVETAAGTDSFYADDASFK